MILLALACATTPEAPAVAAIPVAEPPPYGFWGMNGYVSEAGLNDVKTRTGMTVFQTATNDPTYATRTLFPTAKAAGQRVTLRLTRDHAHYTVKGQFDLIGWKRMLDVWKDAELNGVIADRTFYGHMLLDDISNFDTRDPDGDELDEMAAYSKQLFPELLVFIREDATELPVPSSGRYAYLDASVNQYKAQKGPVEEYAAAQVAQAKVLGINVIMGLNIADGGDGSSGQQGWRATHWAMSGDEIVRYGGVLAAVPECGMFLNWEYDGEELWSDGTVGAEYFRRPELEAALATLGAQLAARQGVELRR